MTVHSLKLSSFAYSQLLLVTSDKGGGQCVCPRSFVFLSVSKITQKRVHRFGWLRVGGCRDMDKLINF